VRRGAWSGSKRCAVFRGVRASLAVDGAQPSHGADVAGLVPAEPVLRAAWALVRISYLLREHDRSIVSTAKLNTLLRLHTPPIKQLV
jgi:hypothetical protein